MDEAIPGAPVANRQSACKARAVTDAAYEDAVTVLNAFAVTEFNGQSSPYDEIIRIINSDIDYYSKYVFGSTTNSGGGTTNNGGGTTDNPGTNDNPGTDTPGTDTPGTDTPPSGGDDNGGEGDNGPGEMDQN